MVRSAVIITLILHIVLKRFLREYFVYNFRFIIEIHRGISRAERQDGYKNYIPLKVKF